MTFPDPGRPCLVTFHAHPDDEAIFTGGTIAMAVAAGWRVVLVVATSGEEGATPDWLTDDLAAVRRAETLTSARLLGIDRVEFLDYRDSGADQAPDGPPSGRRSPSPGPVALDAAPLHEVASTLRRVLFEEKACALTSYDRSGIYGHRDHVRVHQVAAAAVLATGCDLIEATMGRAAIHRLRLDLLARGLDATSFSRALADGIGTGPDRRLVAVDVGRHLWLKRAAIAAHASQVVEASSFMGLPPGAFHRLLDIEWFLPTRTVDGRLAALLDTARVDDPRDAQLGARRP